MSKNFQVVQISPLVSVSDRNESMHPVTFITNGHEGFILHVYFGMDIQIEDSESIIQCESNYWFL